MELFLSLREIFERQKEQHENAFAVAKDASACLFYAIATTVFYKKAFKKELVPSVVMFAHVGFLLDYANDIAEPVKGLLLMGILCCAFLRQSGHVPLKQDVLLFLFMLLDARWNIINQLLPVEVSYWVRVLFFAVPQFIRKPIWLKNKLQDMRAMFGPLYIFCIAVYMPETSVFMYGMKYTAFFLSFAAGVISRPDNSIILTSLGFNTSFRTRRLCHRYLMITSFICFSLVAALDGMIYFNIVPPLMQNSTFGFNDNLASSESENISAQRVYSYTDPQSCIQHSLC